MKARRAWGVVLGLLIVQGLLPDEALARPNTRALRSRSERKAKSQTKRETPRRKPRGETTRQAPKSARGSEAVSAKVVDLAGGRAYLSAGSEDSVRLGDVVSLGGRSFKVVAVTRNTAAVETGELNVRRGESARIAVKGASEAALTRLATPVPLEQFQGTAFGDERPADTQEPKFVPLGTLAVATRNSAMLLADYALTAPLDGSAEAIGRTRLRARLHWELSHSPVTFDFDGYAELWHASDLALRRNNASRPLWMVRQLELGYAGDSLRGAVGRLRYASRTLGPLDGVRVAARVTPELSVAAFGGVVGDPLTGGLSTDASRFGTELVWKGASAWRPRASLTLQGSNFEGDLDERRAFLLAEAFPDFGRLGARLVVQQFDEQNPWGAATTELTEAGLDTSIEVTEAIRVSGSLDMRRPDRSRWLAAFLPEGFFCVATPQLGLVLPEPCEGGDARFGASASVAVERSTWSMVTGGNVATTEGTYARNFGGFANLSVPEYVLDARLDVGGSFWAGSIVDRAAANLGVGKTFMAGALDASVYYQPARIRYRAGSAAVQEHGVGTRLWWSSGGPFDVQVSGDLVSGPDTSVVFLYGALAWAPRF